MTNTDDRLTADAIRASLERRRAFWASQTPTPVTPGTARRLPPRDRNRYRRRRAIR